MFTATGSTATMFTATTRATLAASLTALLLLPACGGRSTGGGPPPGVRRDAGPPSDGPVFWPDYPPWRRDLADQHVYRPDRQPFPVPDRAFPPDKGKPGTCKPMGHVCANNADCCAGSQCIPIGSGLSLCTMTCQPDLLSTPLVDEDSCPKGGATGMFRCSKLNASTTQATHCLQECAPALGKPTCPPGVACRPESVMLSATADRAVCAYPACTKDADCPVPTSTGCVEGGPASVCQKVHAKAICARDPSWMTAQCSLPGKCDKPSGLCGPHAWGKKTAKVGDPCKDDRGCAGNMSCWRESTAGGVVTTRNGYCVVAGCAFPLYTACPPGSACSRIFYGGRCLKSCDLTQAAECRGYAKDLHGDYECRAWNNLMVGGNLAAGTPVCEPGTTVSCDFLASANLDCSVLGMSSPQNKTNMTCRDMKSGKILPNKHDPNGLCLDDTASGKTY